MAVEIAGGLRIAARLAQIDEVRRWIGSCARRAGVKREAIHDFELALTEALSNTIRHGYREDGSRQIDLSLAIDARQLALTIVDRGERFDPSQRTQPDLESPQEGGYGLYLIDQLTDEVVRRPQPDGSTLITLIKRLRS